MTDPIYSPILKSKLGEAKAVVRLDRCVKDRIIPFFDVLALKPDVPNGADVHEHLEKHVNHVAGAWNGRGICYVDLFDIVPTARGHGGVHPVTIVHDKLSYERVRAIPVVGLERDVPYKLAVRSVVANGVEALAVRLGDEDAQLPSTLVRRVRSLVAELGAEALPLHIFLDFRSIEGMASDVILTRAQRALTELKLLNPARLVFAASAIMPSMGRFKRNTVNRVARRDLLLWEVLYESFADLDYADYGVIDPNYIDFDPRKIKPAAKIRYASDREWIIVKGVKWTTDTTQHRRLSKMLADSAAFRGGDCWGSKTIVSAVNGQPVFRLLEDWVTIDQNTHITHTVQQLSRVRKSAAVVA